jgi:type I site-specific restriction-modification system R (restriction) subunit
MSNLKDLKGGALTEVELNNKSVRQLRKIVKDNRIPKDIPITNMSKTQILNVIKASEWWRRNRLNPVEPEAEDIQPVQQPAPEPETQIIRTNTIQIDEEEGIKPASIVNIDGKYIIKLFTEKKKAEPPAEQLAEIQEQLDEIAENENIPPEVQQEIIESVENQIKEIVQEEEAEKEEEADNPEEVVNIKTKTTKAKQLLKELSKLIKEIEEL